VDFLYELNHNFKTVITEKLDQRTRMALLSQEDPDGMRDSEKQRIRRSIMRSIFGNVQDNI
jgi:hypothetical protein